MPSAAPLATATPAALRRFDPCPDSIEQAPHNPEAPLALSQPVQAVPRLCRLELYVHVAQRFENPYDPAQADVRVRFIGPQGETIVVPAFWYLHQRDPWRSGWRVRFAPPREGTWRATPLLYAPQPQEGATITFEVAPREAPGYVRVHPRNPRYLAFEDGTTFFPIGLNLGWWRDDAERDYARWINALADSGGTVARIWMAPWSFGIEWRDTGLGNYDNRQLRAHWLDQVFALAEQRGVYLVLSLISDREYRSNEGGVWAENPYNAANGGPLQDPRDFVTHPQARALFARRLRYIAARWGYSPNLLAWEFWNEVEATRIETPQLIPWLREMTAVLREADVNHHLTTISYVGDGDPFVWRMEEIDLLQRHEYSPQPTWFRSIPNGFRLTADAPNKPLLFGEFGFSNINESLSEQNREGAHLHNALWASAFNGFATSAMYWWWEDYIAAGNLWSHFQGLARFLVDEDLASFTPMPVAVNREEVIAMGLVRPDRALVWARSVHYDQQRLAQRIAQEQAQALPLQRDVQLRVHGLSDGVYRVDWFDTRSGRWMSSDTVLITGGQGELLAPPFERDVAAKVGQAR
ncbi:MAG: DUF5060 domain-containing protein [Anaerolineae bacterium]|nr:DUF5060 domain-containing protein [Anaerolineae bacterium]